MLIELKEELARRLAERIRQLYGVEHPTWAEVPPRRSLGDLSFATPLQLARVLKKNPRQIAQELVEGFEVPPPVTEVKIEGAGYINLFLDRSAVAAQLLTEPLVALKARPGQAAPKARAGKVVVEHTNINPNKAAHIGHLRNAVLGDVLVNTLRSLGFAVEAQNYIDDTGVQLADVVVGFYDLRGLGCDEVAALPEPFDYQCWDLYSEVGRWYEEDESRRELRRRTLHALEGQALGKGGGPTSGSGGSSEGEGGGSSEGGGEGEAGASKADQRAEMARLVARRIVHRHLATMARLGVGYDLLTRESDILGLSFFEVAFEQLKASGAIHLEEGGKNAGCWVMPLSQSEEFAGLEDPDKVIVRSDGTVTYVGKDIAYQLWKFGLLGRDFLYRRWSEEGLWETCSAGGAGEHPAFGTADRVINVIDARQSYLQRIVKAGLEALGHDSEAERSIHFAYEMVALSADTARALGYLDDGDEDGDERQLEMSGRKGIGVKADDLIDQLEAKAGEEIAERNRELDEAEVSDLAHQIATAALRFFMVKATTTRVIAFDLEEALSFEGETGPYLQYSLVRAGNIHRRLAEEGLPERVSAEDTAQLPSELWPDDLWDLALAVAQTGEVVEKAGETLELSMLARHALDLGQLFNAAYHKHPILREEDRQLANLRLAATQIFERGLTELIRILGIPVPVRM